MHEQSVAIRVPLVNTGNPLVAKLTADYLHQQGIRAEEQVLRGLQVTLAQSKQEKTVVTPEAMESYTSNPDRGGAVGMVIFGVLCAWENWRKNHQSQDALLAIQEHQFGLTYLLKKMGYPTPDNWHLFIPDVFAKDTALPLLQSVAQPIVWNEPARQRLEKSGIRAQVVRPFALDGRLPDSERTGKRDSVIVKFSGAGAPQEDISRIRLALLRLGVQFTIILPDRMITRYETTRFPNREIAIETYKQLLQTTRYKLLISSPSETIMFMTQLWEDNVVHVAGRTKGPHEAESLEVAKDTGLTVFPENIFAMSDAQMMQTLERALSTSAREPDWNILGRSIDELSEVLTNRG